MEKSEADKLRDKKRTLGLRWIDEETPLEKRVSSSGVTFGGRYVVDNRRGKNHDKKLQ